MAETFPKGGEILVATSLCNGANLDTNIDYIKFHFNILQDSLDFDPKAVLDQLPGESSPRSSASQET